MLQTIDLFPLLDSHLITLLKDLSADDWNKPTIAKEWMVRDVAAHLLDGNIRGISIYRDGFFGEAPAEIRSYQDLVDFLNELNASWVKATRRVSPPLLIELLESTGKEYYQQLKKLDPLTNAIFSVAWAGEEVSANWFHIAREYTEKYHHQMQIRDAVGKTAALLTPELFRPFIHTLLMGLPHTYRNADATEGSIIVIEITGEAGGKWFLRRSSTQWQLTSSQPEGEILSTVSISTPIAWKLFTKGISAGDALDYVNITGDTNMGSIATTMVAVMA